MMTKPARFRQLSVRFRPGFDVYEPNIFNVPEHAAATRAAALG
jgi:hypothetical protein